MGGSDVLCAQSINKLCVQGTLVIDPFHNKSIAHGRSYGLSSCGYDVRLAEDVWLWPFWGRLASIVEWIRLPTNLSAEVKDKSTNARMFIFVQNTIIEPGWYGYLTVELTRFLPWPVKLKSGTPIAQIVFHELDKPTDAPYSGKYQNQARTANKAILDRGTR